MATAVPPKRNSAYVFYTALASQASSTALQTNPTLAAGDVQVSIDGGAFANLTTLPTVTPAGGKAVKVSLSAPEMNGDNIVVLFSDVAGAEWCEQLIELQTAEQQINDLLPTSSYAAPLDAAGTRTALGLASSNLDTQLSGIQTDTDNLQTRLPTALVSGRMDASVGSMAPNTLTASALATDAVTEMQAGLSTLDQAGVRAALGLASPNLDTQLSTLASYV